VGELRRSINRIAYRRPEAAEALGVSETKFREWEARGLLPSPVKIDGVTLYDAQELLLAWDTLKSGTGRRGFREPNPYDT
jgi:DNA-binding transcriptional MerR regulator